MTLSLPDPDTTQLPNSPLELVVCQVRFEEHPEVVQGEVALAFYETLGGSETYFGAEQTVTGSGNIVMGPSGPVVNEGAETRGWRFRSKDGTWVVALQPDHVSLETTEYGTWGDHFSPLLAEILAATAKHVAPSFEQRLGLRYIDRITELELRSLIDWKPYIREELLGPICHPDLGESIQAVQQRLEIEVAEGITCSMRHGGVIDAETGTVDYLLDYDLHRDGGRRFDVEEIEAAAAEFNTCALQLFHASITDELLRHLKGEER